MKVLHSALFPSPPIGVVNQMMWEQKAAEKLKLDWQVKIFCPFNECYAGDLLFELRSNVSSTPRNGSFGRMYSWFFLRWEYVKWLKVQEDKVDVFILRHSMYDLFQLIFILTCKKKVLLNHHTLEVPELLASGGWLGRVKAFCEGVIGRYAIRYATAIVGVTEEVIQYERIRSASPSKRTILYPNGILYNNKLLLDQRGDVPNLLFVASYFAAWHGLDRLLMEVWGKPHDFILHVVGDLSDEDRLLAERDCRVMLHGRKSHDEINLIAAQCHLGLSSFALDRNSMTEACTLKVREYLMMGLPVCAGYIEVLPLNFRFYKKVNMSLDEILAFAIEHKFVSRECVANEARLYIDKVALVEGLAHNLEGI